MVDGCGDLQTTVLQPWDMPFYMQKLKAEGFDEVAEKMK